VLVSAIRHIGLFGIGAISIEAIAGRPALRECADVRE